MLHFKIKKLSGLEDFKAKYIIFLRNEGTDEALRELRKEVQTNTEKGIDYRGVAFKEYSDQTKKVKREGGQQVDPPNLRDTGAMRGSLSVRKLSGEKVLTVGDKEMEKAQWMMEGTKYGEKNPRPPRRFLGANTGDARLMSRLRLAIERAWKRKFK